MRRTISEQFIINLRDHGLSEQDALSILDKAISHPEAQGLPIKWVNEFLSLPAPVAAALWYFIKKIAIEWLEENRDGHVAIKKLQIIPL